MFSQNQQGDLLSAPPCYNLYDWLNVRKASHVQLQLHEQHGPNGAASGWPATGARYCGKIVTRWKVVNSKEDSVLASTCRYSFVSLCTLFSFSTVTVRVLAPLNRTAWIFLWALQFSPTVEILFNNMHPSITIYFNSRHPFILFFA